MTMECSDCGQPLTADELAVIFKAAEFCTPDLICRKCEDRFRGASKEPSTNPEYLDNQMEGRLTKTETTKNTHTWDNSNLSRTSNSTEQPEK